MRFVRHTTQAMALLVLSTAAGRLEAQQQVTQTVRLEVIAVNRGMATATVLPVASRATSAAAARGTLSLTTNEANQKVTASLDRPLPAGMMLSVAISAPSGVESAGRTMLSAATASDVVTGIPTGDTKSMPVQFVVSGGEATRVVTYTVVGAP